MNNHLLTLGYIGAGAHYTTPYDSTQGIPQHTQEIVFVVAISIIAYISFRVWLSVKKDEKKNKFVEK